MAFVKKTWKDRLVEYAGRRQLKRVSGDANSTMIVDVSRSEGTVSQPGDAFSAANMNDMEKRIEDGFSDCVISDELKKMVKIKESEYQKITPDSQTIYFIMEG
ncbi:MAG: hypothetical protein NC094_12110 [Bacteroidales bacterium]|nr:hypothetical protein [Lachnoclostridium sp.]MCM1385260.1 hypothetical protein [Lachnoclostridium sp.]MCM1466154.1 hypothetical protein [Bacteroidales bacterium]